MRRVLRFSLCLLPLMITSGMFYSVLPIYISKELGASETIVGSLFTVGALTGAIVSVGVGKISDRFGRKRTIVLSKICFGLVVLMYSIITDYMFAYPIHVLEGFAWAMVGVSAPAYISELSEKRGESLGVYNTVVHVGWVIGPIFGGLLAETFGFRFMLRIAFILIIFGILAVLRIEEFRCVQRM